MRARRQNKRNLAGADAGDGADASTVQLGQHRVQPLHVSDADMRHIQPDKNRQKMEKAHSAHLVVDCAMRRHVGVLVVGRHIILKLPDEVHPRVQPHALASVKIGAHDIVVLVKHLDPAACASAIEVPSGVQRSQPLVRSQFAQWHPVALFLQEAIVRSHLVNGDAVDSARHGPDHRQQSIEVNVRGLGQVVDQVARQNVSSSHLAAHLT
mmetsp:Transcript_60928/g.199483  ORF Transcript_60928/g.199483 Transcript_60928/m.199483 type:complete len:210 (-) Transcript_60928:80-709(-)